MQQDATNQRKIEHINAFDVDKGIERDAKAFDNIELSHRALPNINLADIDTTCEFLGKPLSFPLLISSMTGGNHELVATINKNLALAAEACGVAMAVGSQRVMFVEEAARASFELRQHAPKAVLIANIGAVQLNYGFDADKCQQAVDILQADGLYLHLNPLQEAVQPEGDTNFANLTDKIKQVVADVSVPVLFKEVGSGLSVADVQVGLDCGIRHFDVAGTGGTSWSRIEYHRRQQDADDLGLVFQDWGIDTPQAVFDACNYLQTGKATAQVIASGGIRSGIDMVKSLLLGASLCGVAAPLLKPAMVSVDDTIAAIERLKKEFTTAMFLLGVSDISSLVNNRALIRRHQLLSPSQTLQTGITSKLNNEILRMEQNK